MANLRNCIRCGKMFNYITGKPICMNCKKELEQQFQSVKKYIRENPQATISQICKDCEVKKQQIEEWIREERLMFAKDSPIKLYCENCGTPIQTGRFCAKCKGEVKNGLKNTADAVKPKQVLPKGLPRDDGKGGMRFINT